ncbi:MAG: phenylphosphate synthase subunit beta, partial [Proteobacteria bacterium]|nr:phenylphosphate synthase subunit beta [Pseudomonadota bacterium]NIS68450.1 phenylphosphate synthase subunit beta [Pseudomonadota bacterium]
MEYVLNFREVDQRSIPLVGGKNASLGEMIKAGIRVPPGFAVTTDTYSGFITEAGINDQILSILSDADPDNVDSLNKAGAEAQKLIKGAPISDQVKRAIVEAYSQLCEKCFVEMLPVAVRSSATAEDLPTASFAGQQ